MPQSWISLDQVQVEKENEMLLFPIDGDFLTSESVWSDLHNAFNEMYDRFPWDFSIHHTSPLRYLWMVAFIKCAQVRWKGMKSEQLVPRIKVLIALMQTNR